MTTTTDAPEHVHEHPSDAQYVKVAFFLAVVTAVEVATYFYEDASTTFLVAFLFPLMIIKFVTVTFYFMHLKYDAPIFKRVFYFGLILAVIVFTIALFAFDFFSNDYLKYLRG